MLKLSIFLHTTRVRKEKYSISSSPRVVLACRQKSTEVLSDKSKAALKGHWREDLSVVFWDNKNGIYVRSVLPASFCSHTIPSVRVREPKQSKGVS